MLRPNALSHWLDRRIERLPKGTFLLVRAVKEKAWSVFRETLAFEYLDRKEHEYNLEALARRWGERPREGEEFKDEQIATWIKTLAGKKELAIAMYKRKKAEGKYG
jgi:hypothetical protein